jgi:hypothetical protein
MSQCLIVIIILLVAIIIYVATQNSSNVRENFNNNDTNDIPPYTAYVPFETPPDQNYVYFADRNVYLLPFSYLNFNIPFHRWMYFWYPEFYSSYYKTTWPYEYKPPNRMHNDFMGPITTPKFWKNPSLGRIGYPPSRFPSTWSPALSSYRSYFRPKLHSREHMTNLNDNECSNVNQNYLYMVPEDDPSYADKATRPTSLPVGMLPIDHVPGSRFQSTPIPTIDTKMYPNEETGFAGGSWSQWFTPNNSDYLMGGMVEGGDSYGGKMLSNYVAKTSSYGSNLGTGESYEHFNQDSDVIEGTFIPKGMNGIDAMPGRLIISRGLRPDDKEVVPVHVYDYKPTNQYMNDYLNSKELPKRNYVDSTGNIVQPKTNTYFDSKFDKPTMKENYAPIYGLENKTVYPELIAQPFDKTDLQYASVSKIDFNKMCQVPINLLAKKIDLYTQ